MADADELSVPSQWIEIAAAEHRRLLQRLDELVANGTLDASARSRLPDWTVGHVLTHVAQSADGHVRMLDAAASGEVGVQYPGGVDGRIAGIEAGAQRPAAEQVEGLRRSCTSGPNGMGQMTLHFRGRRSLSTRRPDSPG